MVSQRGRKSNQSQVSHTYDEKGMGTLKLVWLKRELVIFFNKTNQLRPVLDVISDAESVPSVETGIWGQGWGEKSGIFVFSLFSIKCVTGNHPSSDSAQTSCICSQIIHLVLT